MQRIYPKDREMILITTLFEMGLAATSVCMYVPEYLHYMGIQYYCITGLNAVLFDIVKLGFSWTCWFFDKIFLVFDPVAMDYSVSVSLLLFKNCLEIGYQHTCSHPVITYNLAGNMANFEGSFSKLYVSFVYSFYL